MQKNLVTVDPKPFHPDTYIGPEQEEDEQPESLRIKGDAIKLRVENTIRWRWTKDALGHDVRLSLVQRHILSDLLLDSGANLTAV